MRCAIQSVLVALAVGAAASAGHAQPREDESSGSPQQSAKSKPPNTAAVDAIVGRMMAFDKNQDGKLTKDEITDPRLQRLFDRADANHDGVVTKEELTALARKMVAESSLGRDGRRGPGGMGRGPRPPQPGQVLSPRSQEMLLLSAAQKAKIEALQKEVDAKLAKILTDVQKKRLKEMMDHGGKGPPPPGEEDLPNGNGQLSHSQD